MEGCGTIGSALESEGGAPPKFISDPNAAEAGGVNDPDYEAPRDAARIFGLRGFYPGIAGVHALLTAGRNGLAPDELCSGGICV